MSRRKLPTITIGVPAYNEEKNIRPLIVSLLNQEIVSFRLEKLLVVSDGSTDNTVYQVKKIRNRKIELIANPKRQGLPNLENQIFRTVTSDILIVIQADINITDRRLVNKLASEIINGHHLVSCDIRELPGRSYLSRILAYGMCIKRSAYNSYHDGDNFFTCHGLARAYARDFYSGIQIPSFPGEDFYTYLYCKFHGFRYRFVSDTAVYYRVPETLSEHLLQSARFFTARQLLSEKFSGLDISSFIRIPVLPLLLANVVYFFRQPISFISYWSVVAYTLLATPKLSASLSTSKWQIALSSKYLNQP